ncbi:MAG: hypothetical protein M3Q29_25035 [Chloroflexota bacterium]|nr:hypothetical protein [Chloroflexota bacterium]
MNIDNGSATPRHKTVWDGGADIDIYYELNGKAQVIETKVEAASVRDVYQLVMYWDGLVAEGKQPTKGTLIAQSFPANVDAAIKHLNGLTDGNGNNYSLEVSTLGEWSDLGV